MFGTRKLGRTTAQRKAMLRQMVTDFLHSKGKFCDLHSCGQNMKQVPNMIKAGWDSWCPQAMNDTAKEYELYGDKIIIGVMPKAHPLYFGMLGNNGKPYANRAVANADLLIIVGAMQELQISLGQALSLARAELSG